MEVSGQLHGLAALPPLDRGMGEPQSRSGRRAEQENISALAGDRTPTVQPVARRYAEWAVSVPVILK
jgi:hypothetical protein